MSNFILPITISIITSTVAAFIAYHFAVAKFKENLIFKEVYLRRLDRLEELCKRAHSFRRALSEYLFIGSQKADMGKVIEAQNNFKGYIEDNAIYFKKTTVDNFKSLFFEGLDSLRQLNLKAFADLQEKIEEKIRHEILSDILAEKKEGNA